MKTSSEVFDNNLSLTFAPIYESMDSIAELYPGTILHRPTVVEYARGLELRGRLTPVVQEAVQKAEYIRASSKVIIYVAGALTGVDEETKARYGTVSDLLASYGTVPSSNIVNWLTVQEPQEETMLMFGYVPHLHGTDPVKHPQVTKQEVRDIDNLFASVIADFHINFLDPIAHGNAIELGWSEKNLIPTVFLVPEGKKLSRLTEGMDNIERVITYKDFAAEGIKGLEHFADELAQWLKTFPNKDPRLFFYQSLSIN